jgi:hypothetical protein
VCTSLRATLLELTEPRSQNAPGFFFVPGVHFNRSITAKGNPGNLSARNQIKGKVVDIPRRATTLGRLSRLLNYGRQTLIVRVEHLTEKPRRAVDHAAGPDERDWGERGDVDRACPLSQCCAMKSVPGNMRLCGGIESAQRRRVAHRRPSGGPAF